MPAHQEPVYLLPAAGEATRIDPLPCSEELYPIGFRLVADGQSTRPKVAAHYLLENASRRHRKDPCDLVPGLMRYPELFWQWSHARCEVGILMLNLPFGTPYTLCGAYLFVQRSIVAFCFADILLESDDAFVLLLARQSQTNACATLGWFPAGQFGKVDLVNIAPDGRVRQIVIKPHHTQLSHSWCIALRTPVFTEFLIAYIAAHKQTASDVSIGDVIQAAIEVGMHIEAVPVSGKSYLNIGTAEDLGRAVQPDAGSDD